MSSSTDHEVIVLGGGIVSLATAYRQLKQEPSLSATRAGAGSSGRYRAVEPQLRGRPRRNSRPAS